MNKLSLLLACLCLACICVFTGCHSYEVRVYDVNVQNNASVPITIWLTKDGPPYEPGWLAPEDIAIESPKQPAKIIGGVVVPQGKTANTGPLKGQFEPSTHAVLRVYAGQLNFDELLASPGNEKTRIDMTVHPGRTDLIVTGSAGRIDVKESAPAPGAPPEGRVEGTTTSK
jgi:hypothetical protein